MHENTMKTTLFTFLLTLVFTTGLFAQQTITNEKHERVLSHVHDNIFDVQFFDKSGTVVQEGQYWKERNKYKPHGMWKLYAYNTDEVVTKATFHKGKQLTIETKINGELVKADKYKFTAKK